MKFKIYLRSYFAITTTSPTITTKQKTMNTLFKPVFSLVALIWTTFSVSSQTPEFSLLASTSGMGDERISFISTDAKGNVYGVGSATQQFTYANQSITPFTPPFIFLGNPFIARYSVDGSLDWALPVGRDSLFTQVRTTCDSQGNLYMIMSLTFGGEVGDTMWIGNNYYDIRDSASAYVFLAKIDSTGQVLWGKEIRPAASPAMPVANFTNPELEVDSQDNLIFTAYFSESFYFDTIRVDKVGSTDGNLLAKVDPNGNFLFARSFGSYGNDGQQFNLRINDQDEILLAGGFEGDTIFVDGLYAVNPTPGGFFNTDNYLCKFNSSGQAQWIIREGSPIADYNGYPVPTAGGGSMMVTPIEAGQFIEFNEGAGSASGPATVATTYDAQGNYQSHFVIPNLNFLNDVQSSGSDIYLNFVFSSPQITIGSTTLNNAGGNAGTNDIGIARMDQSGNVDWAVGLGGPDEEWSNSIVISPVFGLVLGGSTTSSQLVFGQDTLTNLGLLTNDGFFAALNSDIGIPGFAAPLKFEIYPNPARASFIIMGIDEVSEGQIRISNVSGRLIRSATFGNDFQGLEVNVSDLPAGVYLLEVLTNKGSGSTRLVKQ